ncbi:MAG: thioredoxin domain-containing protein [Bacteroidia bacterium]|nr:thioredoxin domain-containing protein [Bacteroidia bacterium]
MQNTTESTHTNHLIHETSPYLLQHAHNPVEWYSWGDEAWDKAKKENKLVLVSIGYSSCHWCHVMEHESFEDSATAQMMNENYVCIKVDREERPDIDQVYMTAVQLMTGSGGWPLNCFTLPDGRPLFGGTYFPNGSWKDVLVKLHDFYTENPDKAKQYAEELVQGIKKSEPIKVAGAEPKFSSVVLKDMVESWKKTFDKKEGGPNRAPKFPMPNNYEFLLRYYYASKDESALNQVLLTLDKMAFGGIYDQVGGGFARYSTDALWKAPHFEKMLYDNAQLVTLYSYAYQLTRKELYKDVVYETLGFIEREMTSSGGGFFSALDADSEGEEGKYYVWKREELEKLLGDKSKLFFEYYNVNATGLWEHGNYILLRKKSDEEIAKQFSISVQEAKKNIAEAKKNLLKEREKRIHPGLDDKIITSWNALLIKAYAVAFDVFGEKKFLDAALKASVFIMKNSTLKDGGLEHHTHPKLLSSNSEKESPGFLEDYSFLSEAFISLYQSSLDEKWLNEAKRLTDYAVKNFYDEPSCMFHFTSSTAPQLITRQKEIQDNVIPASNSSMAKALFELSIYFDEKNYRKISQRMLSNVKDDMASYGSSYSNWAMLMLNETYPFYEVAIDGKEARNKLSELNQKFIPNKLIAASESESSLSLLQERFVAGKTLIYVCENSVCKLPVQKTEEAFKLIK